MAAAKSRSFSATAWVSKDVMGGKLRPIERAGCPMDLVESPRSETSL